MTAMTHMRLEIEEIPEVVARFLSASSPVLGEAAARLRTEDPAMVITIARGSSDHASAYLKYAIELTMGLPVASVGPSIASIYGRDLRLSRAVALAISQSGKSPDIVGMAQSARRSGATTLAITNTAGSPLAQSSDFTIELHAGIEKSVAATKTFVTSVVAGLALLAHWSGDVELQRAVAALPERLAGAVACDWSEMIPVLDGHDALYVLGRGPGFAIANEAALKFKETCGIQGESYSAAEVMHGPVSIVNPGYPVLGLAARDAAEKSVADMAHKLAGQGASAFLTSDLGGAARRLPFAATGHPITDPLALVVSFYGFVEALARHRGLNPDEPPMLKKVTETL
ncbi:Glutamine--fructose-6-phosphate aminotransferase [isomerizing] [Devosia equisanguinis]|uniref:Glutamine--fructose-6-phosphate aminotransferase [isomerizing] n=1 Tax=Devosia equisanguinis TaxID=2490941 RepID=A0A3S4DRV4_9HYPH|nr:SIS domain-containing protein [Devosia equisanguinis]VDS05777.1 Glutamine--fructose-6-phosphate aminotransferase [isomerizing] [Devosia equisanguinis]